MIELSKSYLIQAENLSYHYGGGDMAQRVLKGASLSVASGEFVILVGPSGSGKSTLLTLIGALRGCQEGSLNVIGQDIRTSDEEEMRLIRRNIGYVFQQHNLLGFLTALQNVEMTMEMFPEIPDKQKRDLATEMLVKVGLENQLHRYPSQLSVGQKQRVSIARSLVHQPKLILADEPTASLDKASGIHVVELLHGMVKDLGCGALVVTHDNRIFDYADRILHIEDGVVTA